MHITRPSRLTFWRTVLLITVPLPFLAIWDFLRLASDLGVLVRASTAWIGLLSALGIGGLAALLILISTCPRTRERTLSLLEFPAQIRAFGFILLPLALFGYSIVFTVSVSTNLLGDLGWVRFLILWLFSLTGMYALKTIKKDLSWLTALLTVALFQTLIHLLATQLSAITSYPFSMGWSETSRHYYPALFLSGKLFGQRLPWPILHPSLHLLLVPPYIFDAPLWFHRFWQVFLRISLLTFTARALLWRLDIKERCVRWLLWIWMILYLFQGPIYFHLTIPLILMLWGYSTKNDRRTWIFLIFASSWSGLSRINWYPMPGILASVLFLLEIPYNGQKFWRYLRKPVIWTMVGFAVAFLTQRGYIAISGIPDPDFFYTSLTSNLLWYRLFPNASYSVGVLPAALIASLPLWLAAILTFRWRRADIHPLRLTLLVATLLVFFAGGLLVSMKIGGGVDIHNLDAYLGLLLIVTAYVVFGRYTPESGETKTASLHWGAVMLLLAVPAWFLLGSNIGIKTYDRARTQAIINTLQTRVDNVNARGGEILFITQRHLMAMHMLENVIMVPEYEREELMEMAMGNNRDYLEIFRTDMENQRFAAIIVDPLAYRLLGKNYAFGEENNAWVQRVMKPILCNYQEDDIFLADQIAIYIPQGGEQLCPK